MSGFDRMPDPRGDASASGRRARRALLGADVEPSPAMGSEPGPGMGSEPGPGMGSEPGPGMGSEPGPGMGSEPDVGPDHEPGGVLVADGPAGDQARDEPAAQQIPAPGKAAVEGPGVACTRCGRSSVLGVASLLTLLRPPVLFLPWKAAPLLAVCPACRRRTWLHPRLEVCAPA